MRITLTAAAVLTLSHIAFAGPLDPPVGPIAPSFKTILEAEPRTAINATNTPASTTALFRISQPGSYYLTGNITGVSGKNGIEILASGVNIDLMGFSVTGVAGALDGIATIGGNYTDVRILNGTVRNWPSDGINLTGAANSRLQCLTVSGNTSFGILAGANNCVITDCCARTNGGGIRANDGAVITGCSAQSNTGAGITVNNGGVVTTCSALSNGGNGVTTGSSCAVTACTLTSNSGHGIATQNSCSISGCTAQSNTLDGIHVNNNCTVLSNTSDSNGNGGTGAGIHALAGGNRIEGNNASNADRGVLVDAASNIIIRNTCWNNTIDWDIVVNNVFGPILDRRSPGSAAVSGFSAASTLGSTDPNANFSY
jgi:parallel beta-helix repeat protein